MAFWYLKQVESTDEPCLTFHEFQLEGVLRPIGYYPLEKQVTEEVMLEKRGGLVHDNHVTVGKIVSFKGA